jgi:predicted dinucleotide-binding enzyme
MKVGILGTGDVGRALGKGFVTLGHEVKLGGRAAGNEKARAWVTQMGGAKASEGTFADAAAFGELIVVATLGLAVEEAVRAAEPGNFRGKVVIDTTNPLDTSKGMPPTLASLPEGSGGERLQRLVPDAHVVKAFNTVGNGLMFRPQLPGGPPDMFVAGNDAAAKAKVAELLHEFGWGVADLGGIGASRYLEAMCIVWVLHGVHSGSWSHAFKILHK